MNSGDKSGAPSRGGQLLVFLVAAAALRFWIFHPHERLNPAFIVALPFAAVLLVVRPLNRRIDAALAWLNRSGAAHRGWAGLLVGMGALVDLLLEAWRARGMLFLKLHDEHSYMIGARMAAHGRLWAAGYPADVRDFFDTFHVIVDRVYASMYFPGTALVNAPAIGMGLAYWVTPLVLCAAAAAIFFTIMAEMFDTVRGLTAVVMLLSLAWFRWAATSMMSMAPFLAAELLLVWAWLRWRRQHGAGWAALIGAAAGFGAITRPIDMSCFAAAVGIAMVWELRHRRRELLICVGWIVLCAAPFLALLMVQNIGVTGRWDQTAEGYYEARNYPAPMVGFFRFEPARVPQFVCPPKQDAMQNWISGLYRDHTFARTLANWYPARFEQLLDITLGNRLLIVLVCVGLLGLVDIRRLVLFGAMILFLGAYFTYVFALDQYMIPLMPVMICLVLMGWDRLERTWPKLRSGIRVAMVVMLLALSICALPEFNPAARANPGQLAVEAQINRRLAMLPPQRAVVMFRFDPAFSFHADPVYNDDVIRPDDAQIVRVNDLGPRRDRDLYRYYAERQRERIFYIYDLGAAAGTDPLSRPLGTARFLADHSTSIASP